MKGHFSMSTAAADIVLGEIAKGDTEKIVVSKKEYQGHEYIDIRIHFKMDDGRWQFTKKGVTLSPKKAKDLIEILQKIQ